MPVPYGRMSMLAHCQRMFQLYRKKSVATAIKAEALKKKPSKSLYARATDTGVDPREAAKRLNIDWDTAAEIEDTDTNDENEVPPAVVC
ncbi:hypothetical protein TIFTF001_025256 [Ficus carica]|uniref:Uncharacterized protein n=1 Tax=Ficus carica TaxID=3494 RepID=A0AA88ANF9_FICCA|nr:hypothetical protein TIFTF001_025256 [Ficus carica]